jgi:hypothetical protein
VVNKSNLQSKTPLIVTQNHDNINSAFPVRTMNCNKIFVCFKVLFQHLPERNEWGVGTPSGQFLSRQTFKLQMSCIPRMTVCHYTVKFRMTDWCKHVEKCAQYECDMYYIIVKYMQRALIIIYLCTNTYVSRNTVVKFMAFLLYIRFAWGPATLTEVPVVFLSVSSGKCWYSTENSATTASFQILPNALFTYHRIIRGYTVQTTNDILK